MNREKDTVMYRLLVVALFALVSLSAQAALNTVATTTSMEMLLREIGGKEVRITTLAPPDRDAHSLQVRPSMMQALRQARLLVAIGAELEAGWLPAALGASANPTLLPGQDGYFEAAAQVPLLEVKGAAGADRSQGDVHPMGNPHVQMDPVRLADVALALAERLAKLDPAHAADFRAHAKEFQQAVQAKLPAWTATAAGAPGALMYHKDANYLLARFNVPVLGYLEPLPGLPPTASHLAGLLGNLRGKRGIVLHTPYQSHGGIAPLAANLGWHEIALPIDPPAGATRTSYFALIDRWLAAVAQAK